MKKLKIGLIVIQYICLFTFVFLVVVYYQCRLENERLNELKEEYQYLKNGINSYIELKNNYLVMLEEEQGLNNEQVGLEGKVQELNKQISDLQGKIKNVQKKISAIS